MELCVTNTKTKLFYALDEIFKTEETYIKSLQILVPILGRDRTFLYTCYRNFCNSVKIYVYEISKSI